MPDKDGKPANACDCPEFKRTGICLHSECIEQFFHLMPEPVVEGEDPDSFLVSLQRNKHLYFSVASKSGSQSRQSQKRTIVQCTSTRQWKCKSCPKLRLFMDQKIELIVSNCIHIAAAQREAMDLDLNVGERSEGDTAAQILTSRSISTTKPVSFRQIPPPAWIRLPQDRSKEKPFRSGVHIPDLLCLNEDSRCSCGSRQRNGLRDTQEICIFTSSTAVTKRIETEYCIACRFTKGRIGPDLSEYGVFNWNNRVAFSHELMNNYTSQFTTSSTPFFAFHQTIVHSYESEESPIPFISLQLFLSAYFAFRRLQDLETKMQCSICGPNPAIVIADGVSISFPRHKVTHLRPPTYTDQDKACTKIMGAGRQHTAFLAPAKVRSAFQKAFEMTDIDKSKDELKRLMELHQVIMLVNDHH
jgi:hypothetical protein